MDQAVVFKVEAQHAVRGHQGACRHAQGQVKTIVRAVSGGAGRAIRQVTETQAAIGRQAPFLTDEILANQAAGIQIPVPIASLAAR